MKQRPYLIPTISAAAAAAHAQTDDNKGNKMTGLNNITTLAVTALALSACGGGGGDTSNNPNNTSTGQPKYQYMRYMDIGGIPYVNGPDAPAQGSTTSNGTLTYEGTPPCNNNDSASCLAYYPISLSIGGNPLGDVYAEGNPYEWWFQGSLNIGAPVPGGTYQLPPGYSNNGAMPQFLPTDGLGSYLNGYVTRTAENIVRVSLMDRIADNIETGLQLSPTLAQGSFPTFPWDTLTLETDSAAMQAAAPHPLATKDEADAYLLNLLVCRRAGAWGGPKVNQGTTPQTGTGATANSQPLGGDLSIVFDAVGNMTAYFDFQSPNTSTLYPDGTSVTATGQMSLASDDITYTVPSGPLAGMFVDVNSNIVRGDQGPTLDWLGPDQSYGYSHWTPPVGMFEFNPRYKFVVPQLQGTNNQWTLVLWVDDSQNVGGYITSTPHYQTVIALTGSLQGNTLTFNSFDWNQGRKEGSSPPAYENPTTAPTTAPPAVNGTLTITVTRPTTAGGTIALPVITGTGTVTMPSDGLNAAPIAPPGCYS